MQGSGRRDGNTENSLDRINSLLKRFKKCAKSYFALHCLQKPEVTEIVNSPLPLGQQIRPIFKMHCSVDTTVLNIL